jgi:hypothetical protein
MAEISKDEAQALVNAGAPLLRLAHDLVNDQAAAGNALAILLKPAFDTLHVSAAKLVPYAGLSVPEEEQGGVSTRSGGPK